jgi:hypothetical protein
MRGKRLFNLRAAATFDEVAGALEDSSARHCGRPLGPDTTARTQRLRRLLRSEPSAARCAAELPRAKLSLLVFLCKQKTAPW